jgi:hypothetical protein
MVVGQLMEKLKIEGKNKLLFHKSRAHHYLFGKRKPIRKGGLKHIIDISSA